MECDRCSDTALPTEYSVSQVADAPLTTIEQRKFSGNAARTLSFASPNCFQRRTAASRSGVRTDVALAHSIQSQPLVNSPAKVRNVTSPTPSPTSASPAYRCSGTTRSHSLTRRSWISHPAEPTHTPSVPNEVAPNLPGHPRWRYSRRSTRLRSDRWLRCSCARTDHPR